MRLNSMRARMTALFTTGIAAVTLTASATLVLYTRYITRQQADQVLADSIAQVQHELSEAGHSKAQMQEFVQEQNEDLRWLGSVLFATNRSGQIIIPPPGQAQQAPVWPPAKEAWRFANLAHGDTIFVVALPWQATERRTDEMAFVLMGLSLLIICTSAGGAWILVGRTLSPIDHLASQARRGTEKSQTAHLEAPSNDREITHLVATFNQLLEFQRASAAARGRFYAAASHELRTPLQALQGHLELALQRPREAAQYRETIVEADAQTRRLSELVQALLFLNQLEMSNAKPPLQEADLADICERFLMSQRATIDAKNLHIESIVPDKMLLRAPGNHPEVLVRNLLENAVKYTPDGGEIRVLLSENGPHLEIFNECAPIESDNLQRLCEPFFRPDAARHSQTGGNGLGLAICKAICEINNWNLILENVQAGLKVRVNFFQNPPLKRTDK